jgi:hypothetical protein
MNVEEWMWERIEKDTTPPEQFWVGWSEDGRDDPYIPPSTAEDEAA